MVQTNSENPPGRESEVARLVAAMCEDLGMEVTSHEAEAGRPNVIARKTFGSGPVVGYCSHLDTVPVGDPSSWRHDPLGAVVEDGKLWGRGACDAKGPIAAALEAVAVLLDGAPSLRGTLELELVSGEETMGFVGAKHLVEAKLVAPHVVVVGEPTSLSVVVAQRGVCWLEIETRGRAAHGSAPERGVNAIAHMAEIIGLIEDSLPDVSHPVLGGPSINVGTIRGGAKVNMVAASCVVEVDRRTIPGESPESVVNNVQDAIERARARYPDIDARVRVAFSGSPFEIGTSRPLVREVSEAMVDATGRPAELMGFRGASDARFFAAAGIDVVVCGPGDIAVAHTVSEHVDIDELERAALAYALTFARLLGRG